MNLNNMTPDEVRRQGDAIYAEQIRPHIEPQNAGKIVVLDLESGDYEMGEDDLTVSEIARKKHPNGILYVVRVGADSTYHLGAGWSTFTT